jgi:hypothetical protein
MRLGAGQLLEVRQAVKDPQDWETVTFYLGEGMPITSQDPNKETVPKRVKMPRQNVRHRCGKRGRRYGLH